MITLTHSGSPLQLPNPQLGDSLAYRNSAKINRSMNGTLWIYKNQVPEEITWEFREVSRSKIQQIESYFKAKRGVTFAVVDHKGNNFNAKIVASFGSTDSNRGSCSTTNGDFTLVLQKI